MTIPETLDTAQGRTLASKQVQQQLNELWEKEFFPLVYNLFQKDAKPTRNGNYVEFRKKGSIGKQCDLESLQFKEIEIACNPSVKWPPKPEELQALFEGRGTQRAFDSLRRQVLCECCKALTVAGYRPENTKDINEEQDYFEKFINRTAERYQDEIYAGLTMSKISVLPADDPGCLSDDPEEFRQPRIGMVVYLTMNLWVRTRE